MHKTIIGIMLTALAATACSGAEGQPGASEPAEETASSSAALTASLPAGYTTPTYTGSITIGSCLYQVGSTTLSTVLPPKHTAVVNKSALAASCATPYGYQLLGTSYASPGLSIAKGPNNAIGVSLVGSSTPSGSAPKQATLYRLDPSNLNVLLTDFLSVPPAGLGVPYAVQTANLVFTVPGDLLVIGTKEGKFPGELGAVGGSNYQATFTNFATTTTTAGASQILAW